MEQSYYYWIFGIVLLPVLSYIAYSRTFIEIILVLCGIKFLMYVLCQRSLRLQYDLYYVQHILRAAMT